MQPGCRRACLVTTGRTQLAMPDRQRNIVCGQSRAQPLPRQPRHCTPSVFRNRREQRWTLGRRRDPKLVVTLNPTVIGKNNQVQRHQLQQLAFEARAVSRGAAVGRIAAQAAQHRERAAQPRHLAKHRRRGQHRAQVGWQAQQLGRQGYRSQPGQRCGRRKWGRHRCVTGADPAPHTLHIRQLSGGGALCQGVA